MTAGHAATLHAANLGPWLADQVLQDQLIADEGQGQESHHPQLHGATADAKPKQCTKDDEKRNVAVHDGHDDPEPVVGHLVDKRGIQTPRFGGVGPSDVSEHRRAIGAGASKLSLPLVLAHVGASRNYLVLKVPRFYSL